MEAKKYGQFLVHEENKVITAYISVDAISDFYLKAGLPEYKAAIDVIIGSIIEKYNLEKLNESL